MCMLILAKQIKSGWTGRKLPVLKSSGSRGEAHYRVCVFGEGMRGVAMWSCGNPRVCVYVRVWEDPLLYSMALWDCCVFTLESCLIGGYEWAKGLQGDCEASGGGFCQTKKRRLVALGENQTHSLVIGHGREAGEGRSGGSIPHSLLHRQDFNSGRQYTSGFAAHTHTE